MAAASATLTFSYVEQLAVLDPLALEAVPQSYDLCAPHAGRTRPPNGWELVDRRPEHGLPTTDAPMPGPAGPGGGSGAVTAPSTVPDVTSEGALRSAVTAGVPPVALRP